MKIDVEDMLSNLLSKEIAKSMDIHIINMLTSKDYSFGDFLNRLKKHKNVKSIKTDK